MTDPCCKYHTAHVEHFDRIDARIETLETNDREQAELLARMDAILSQLQKLYWIVITACAGCLATALFSVISTR